MASRNLGRRIVCRLFTSDEFRILLSHLYAGAQVYLDMSLDGITIAIGEDECCPDDLDKRIAAALGVAEVTSIHIDDCDLPGVWVAVKEVQDDIDQ